MSKSSKRRVVTIFSSNHHDQNIVFREGKGDNWSLKFPHRTVKCTNGELSAVEHPDKKREFLKDSKGNNILTF
mgnify:CR=1 FL=1